MGTAKLLSRATGKMTSPSVLASPCMKLCLPLPPDYTASVSACCRLLSAAGHLRLARGPTSAAPKLHHQQGCLPAAQAASCCAHCAPAAAPHQELLIGLCTVAVTTTNTLHSRALQIKSTHCNHSLQGNKYAYLLKLSPAIA